MILTPLIATMAHAEPRTPGLHELVLDVDGLERRYTVHLPDLPKEGTVPVVLALHYAGHGAPHYASAFVEQLVVPALKPLGAIIVAPDCPTSSWIDEGSDEIVLSILDHAVRTWKGDPGRVMVTGFSMGGIGAWHLADRHPDRFVAAVPIAGHPRRAGATVTVPVYAIHGALDEQFDPGPTAAAIVMLRGRDVPAFWAPIDGLTHYETAAYVPALTSALPWIEARMPAGVAPATPPSSEEAVVTLAFLTLCAPTMAQGLASHQLPEADGLYERWDPRRSYGAEHVIEALQEVANRVAFQLPLADPLFIGDISAKGGGYLPGHRTHHLGIDVDIGLFMGQGQQPLGGFIDLLPHELDVRSTWVLLTALLDTGQIKFVLLDQGHIQVLRRYALEEVGLDAHSVNELFPPPGTPIAWRRRGVVRHAPNHASHLHVRLTSTQLEDRYTTATDEDIFEGAMEGEPIGD